MPISDQVFERKFWERAHPRPNGCWEWAGVLSTSGYGRVMHRGQRDVATHRLAWEFAHGPIPDGMCVCHSCDNRACVNPDHLWLGTHKQNMADMAAKRRGRKSMGPTYVSPRRKVSESLACAIREDYASGLSLKTVARKHGIGSTTVSKITKGTHRMANGDSINRHPGHNAKDRSRCPDCGRFLGDDHSHTIKGALG